jgi:hypothetical protein
MTYTLSFTADFGSLTGLTLNAKLYDTAGSQTGATITSGFVELGDGVYSYNHAAIPDDHRGTFVIYDSGNTSRKVAISVNPEEAEYTDELRTDWADGGRLDLILDARASQASVDTVDGNVDAILLDTGTDGVIVATNNDKTGYSLSSAGVQAIWDALTSALTTSGSIGKLIVDNLAASGSLAADVWGYATRTLTSTAAATASAVDGSTLNITRAVTYEATISGLTIPATWSKMYFTMDDSNDLHLADSNARIQILDTNGGDAGDGLQYLNGASATASQAELTIDQGAGTIDIVIEDDATQSLESGAHRYDIKVVKSDGRTQVLTAGDANVVLTPTGAVS